MLTNRLFRNNSVTLHTFFKDDSGNPIVLASPVQFTFRDFGNDILASGICIQDGLDTSKWSATFTIPSAAPLTIDDQTSYSLTYTASLPNNTNREITRLYEVVEDKFVVVNNNMPIVITADDLFTDALQITVPFTVGSYTIKLTDNAGSLLHQFAPVVAPAITSTDGNYNLYVFQSNTTLGSIIDIGNNAGSLQVYWSYVVNGMTYNKINPIYILNAGGFQLINNLRMTVDRYKFVDLDPNLVWKDYELLHFVLQGILRINSSNPPTAYTMVTLPTALIYPVSQAALVEACRAWYLAEGMRAFDFQGQAVTLNIDRTQYIQAVMDQANNWLDANMSAIKTSVQVASSMGSRAVATISLSPTSNFPGLQSRYWPASRLL